MGQPFSIVRRTRGGTPFFQVTDHRTHKDYRAATKREATAIAKRIERGEDPAADPNGEGREPGVTREQARRHPVDAPTVDEMAADAENRWQGVRRTQGHGNNE